MRNEILDRYAMLPDGRFVIDIATSRVDELFEDFEKMAPFHKKDLQPDLAEYLVGCVRELGRHDFVVRLSVSSLQEHDAGERIVQSIREYFRYRVMVQHGDMAHMVRRSGLLLLLGIVLMVAVIQLRFLLSPEPSLLATLFYEGLTIVAWIAVWESVAGFFTGWFPAYSRMRIYSRLSGSEVMVDEKNGTMTDDKTGGYDQ
ncbi:hypothetical protein [Prosthecochloris sp. CIB 2401]|uniref:hypothetical protein n=1 Tax=Prosthecochloris sp. CIB 2401 TaxID=1868325 RepID=UPI00080AABA5|nr:hypothetical protein [Prosthecochloris sp. CIB 2401]ANT65713.1 hypothetical protein Ptc2401_01983 [Prosthecochloris sp. CIB 2401]